MKDKIMNKHVAIVAKKTKFFDGKTKRAACDKALNWTKNNCGTKVRAFLFSPRNKYVVKFYSDKDPDIKLDETLVGYVSPCN